MPARSQASRRRPEPRALHHASPRHAETANERPPVSTASSFPMPAKAYGAAADAACSARRSGPPRPSTRSQTCPPGRPPPRRRDVVLGEHARKIPTRNGSAVVATLGDLVRCTRHAARGLLGQHRRRMPRPHRPLHHPHPARYPMIKPDIRGTLRSPVGKARNISAHFLADSCALLASLRKMSPG
jgi:hypothetical protein